MKNLLITSLLLAGSLHAATAVAESGALPAAPMPQPGAAGPEHFSRVFVGETVIRNGQASLDIPLDAASNAYLVVFDEQPITARAPQASGRDRNLPNQPFRNPELQSMGVPSVGARIDLASLPRGAHNVHLETARGSGPLKYAVLQPESSLEMSVQLAPLAARAGEPVTVMASLPGTTAKVNAIVRGAGKVTLRDDGTGADAIANDDVYTGTFTAPRGKGLQEAAVRVDANGQLHDGTPFRRTATAVAMVSHGNAQFIGDAIRIDSNALRIPLNGHKGNYRVEAIFGAEGKTLSWAREAWQGNRPFVELARPAAADRVVIRLLDADSLALADEIALDLEALATHVPGEARTSPAMPSSKARAAERFGVDK